MTALVVSRAILTGGALLLVLGPGFQARLEMREYHELLDALTDGELPPVTQEYLRLLAVGPSLALHSPLGLLKFIATGPSDWYLRYRTARKALGATRAETDERVVQVRTHLIRARNWGIVVLGSLLILIAASVDLVYTLEGGRP